jgi:type I restriction enzyme S subunit
MNSASNQESMMSSDFRLSESVARNLGMRRFPVGTVIFPKRGGAIATNKKRKLGVVGGLDLNLMGVTAKKVLPDYLWFWFQGLDLGTISNGSNVPQINHGDVEPIIVPVPPPDEQTEIVMLLSQAFVKIGNLEREAKRSTDFLQRLDQAILAKGFRGELVAQDVATSSVATMAAE